MTGASRIIVRFKHPTASGRTLADLCDEIAVVTSVVLVRPPTATGRAVFEIPASSDLAQLIERVQALDYVEYVEPDVVDRAQG